MHWDEFKTRANAWRQQLDHVKADSPPSGFTWYGYDIMANVEHLAPLVNGIAPDLLDRISGAAVADIGTADGDLGYLLADMGFAVDLLDWPSTNWNGMRGVRLLGELLTSAATVHAVDLDSQFELPRAEYGLVFLLGILYHLKNPYFVLERLAEKTRYCVISTRIARQSKSPVVDFAELPVAYLLDADECNNDATNFWIFSRAGLVRLVQRCGFRVLASHCVGDTKTSNPSDPDHDERMFMLLESIRI